MNTKHKSDCQRVFKNYDKSCARCQELAAGSAPRQGWQAEYFANKQRNDAQRIADIRSHNCSVSNCGPVCTAFDW